MIKLFLTFIFCCLIGTGCLFVDKNFTVKNLKKKIADEIPLGVNRNKVINFLNKNKIDHTEYNNEERTILANKNSIDMIFNFTETECLENYKISKQEKMTNLNKTEIKNKILNDIIIGSKPEEVISYLTMQNFEHSDYLKDNKVIYAMIREAGKIGLFVDSDIQIIFKFSNENKLVDIQIKEILTGL